MIFYLRTDQLFADKESKDKKQLHDSIFNSVRIVQFENEINAFTNQKITE